MATLVLVSSLAPRLTVGQSKAARARLGAQRQPVSVSVTPKEIQNRSQPGRL